MKLTFSVSAGEKLKGISYLASFLLVFRELQGRFVREYPKVILTASAMLTARLEALPPRAAKGLSIGALAGMLALCCAPSAEATPVVTASVGGGAPAGAILDNLDSLPLGASGGTTTTGIVVSFGDTGQAVQGSDVDVYAAPYVSGSNDVGFGSQTSGPDSSTYASAGGTDLSFAELVFPIQVREVGLLWGSIDTYNTLELLEDGSVVGTITGSQAAAAAGVPASGDQGIDGTAYVTVTNSTPFNGVEALSSQYAFEFDNIAYSSDPVHIPEPSSLPMLLMGLGLIGGLLYFGRRKATVGV